MSLIKKYMDWTEEQWDEYEELQVVVPLTLLDSFILACELLRDGKRLNREEREAWGDKIKEHFPTYLEFVLKISEKGRDSSD